MIPNETLQTVETSGQGVKIVGNFKITDDTQARILVSLSDKMYTRKELAFVREYSTNAADAHIVAKRPISEIIVELPTMENLNFRVRDFGSGLTQEQISNVYCVFGESTKRNTDDQNGMLGYGCKAGFAHADSFTVTSWNSGEKSIYQCIKGDSRTLHSVMLLSRSASEEPSGIEIKIPVKQNSLWTVHREAANFYKHWPEVPTIINMVDSDKERMDKFRNTPPTLNGKGWEIRTKSDSSATGVAYMGWVAYAIDWNVLANRMSLTANKRVLFDLLQSNDVTLSFKMGEVQFIDSREQLEYTDFTLHALMTRIENIFSKIKNSIQEKFGLASNLWDAKKIYNAIFGVGILEVEAGEDSVSEAAQRIRILDGNLMRLETAMKGTFAWNGIPLSPYFESINKFDNAYPTEIRNDYRDPVSPIMVTYRRKKKRAKLNRCTGEKNNSITASDAVTVVLNDTGVKSGQSVVARYLIFKPDSKTRTVHILTFVDDTIKNNFYKEYQFYSVPVIKLSEILLEAKSWNAANKVPRNYGSGGGTRPMEYMDLESGKIEEVEVPVRDLEEGGFYIDLGEGRRNVRKVEGPYQYAYYHPSIVAENLKTLVEKTGLDIDRVYMMPSKTRNSKWFCDAKNSGDWIDVWKFIKENIVDLNIDIQALVDARAYNDCPVINSTLVPKLIEMIRAKDSYIRTVVQTTTVKTYTDNIELITALENINLLLTVIGDTKPSLDYQDIKEKMILQYPMMEHYSYDLEHGRMNEKTIKHVADYINAMDVYVSLYGAETKMDDVEKVEVQS